MDARRAYTCNHRTAASFSHMIFSTYTFLTTKGQSLSILYYNSYNYVLGAMQSHNDENPGQPIATTNRTTTDWPHD